MAETIADNAIIDSPETSALEDNPTIEAPAPKKRGRPSGAKDRAPRVKKAIVIVEEPLQAPPESIQAPEPEKRVASPKKKRAPPPPASESEDESSDTPPVAHEMPEEPPSPRDMYKEASKMIFRLQSTKNDARRTRLQEQYTKGLLAL